VEQGPVPKSPVYKGAFHDASGCMVDAGRILPETKVNRNPPSLIVKIRHREINYELRMTACGKLTLRSFHNARNVIRN
jgi:hypothetical protein